MGVFVVQIPPPAAITPADLRLLKGAVEVQLEWCLSRVLAPWFLGKGAFDLDWIVDPLIDPDRKDRVVDLIGLEVTGLLEGAVLELTNSWGDPLAASVADANGMARLAAEYFPGAPVPRASIRLSPAVVARRGFQSIQERVDRGERPPGAGMTVTRQRFLGQGAIRLAQKAIGIASVPQWGPGQFLVSLPDGLLAIDASTASRPAIVRRWSIPGLQDMPREAIGGIMGRTGHAVRSLSGNPTSWLKNAALSGDTVAHLSDGLRVTIYVQESAPKRVSPVGWRYLPI